MKTHFLYCFIFIFFSCSEEVFPSPDLLAYYPPANSTNTNRYISGYAQFDQKMNTYLNNNLLEIIRYPELEPVDLFTYWENDKKLSFVLTEALLKDSKYRVQYSQAIENEDGINLKQQLSYFFYTGVESNSFNLNFGAFTNGSIFTNQRQTLFFSFTTPVSLSEVQNNISISPDVEHYILSSNELDFVFWPVDKYKPNTRYSLSISESLKSLSGKSLKEEGLRYFYYSSDSLAPRLEQVSLGSVVLSAEMINSNVSKNERFIFTFSEEIPFTSIVNNIVFSDGVLGRFYSGSNASIWEFLPDEALALETIQKITLQESLSDLSGNTLENPSEFFYYVDATNSRYLRLNQVEDNTGTVLEQGGVLSISNNFYEDLKLVFSEELDFPSVLNNISISFFSGSGNTAIQINDIQVESNAVYLDLEGVDAGNTYNLFLKGEEGGIQDIHTNGLKASLDFFFRT